MTDVNTKTGTIKAESQFGYMIGGKWYNFTHDDDFKETVKGKFKKGDEVKIQYEEYDDGKYNLLDIELIKAASTTKSTGKSGGYKKSQEELDDIMKSVLIKGTFETDWFKKAKNEEEVNERMMFLCLSVNGWLLQIRGDKDGQG